MSCTTTYTRGYHYSDTECLYNCGLSEYGRDRLIEEVNKRIAPLIWMPYVSEIWVEVDAEIPEDVAAMVSKDGWHGLQLEIYESFQGNLYEDALWEAEEG